MGGSCSTTGRNEKCVHNFGQKTFGVGGHRPDGVVFGVHRHSKCILHVTEGTAALMWPVVRVQHQASLTLTRSEIAVVPFVNPAIPMQSGKSGTTMSSIPQVANSVFQQWEPATGQAQTRV
jgi:hypothetical protein